MKLNHLHMNSEDLIHKPQREQAIALHKLYSIGNIDVPSVEDIIIKRISLTKYFNDLFKDYNDFEVNEDEMNEEIALCNFLDIDYDGIVPYDPSKNDLNFS